MLPDLSISLFNNILEWSAATFKTHSKGQRDTSGIINHLRQELKELHDSGWSDVEEMADIVFMLVQLAEANGENLEDAIWKKLIKNMGRQWPSEPDENGVYNHIDA